MRAAALHWISGHWCQSHSHKLAPSFNPATDQVLGEFADGDESEALAAIAAARRVFETSPWAHQPRRRAAILLEFASRLESARSEIVGLLTAENGKLLRESDGELTLAISELRYYAGLTRTIHGRISELDHGLHSVLAREPMGVAAIIVPWNAPIILLIRSLAPALAAGCTIVVKSAPQTALVSEAVFRVLSQCTDLPVGAVNMFTEVGHSGSRLLVSSTDVDVVSYTGSTSVGKQIMAAGAGTLKRLNLELGGSAPCIIFPDFPLDTAVTALVRAGMFMCGQQCVAASRLLVHKSILGSAQSDFATALRALRVGPGADPSSEMGPLIDTHNRDRVLKMVTNAGAQNEMLLQGQPPFKPHNVGSFLSPSLIAIHDADSEIANHEIFGPVLTIEPFADEDDAVFKANRSRFGLAASVWTSDHIRAQRVASKVRAGTVWINSHGRLFPETETGGYKESGLGRLHGPQGLDEFLQTKHVSWESK